MTITTSIRETEHILGHVSVEFTVQELLYTSVATDVDAAANSVRHQTEILLRAARGGDTEAWRELHSVLYRINLAAIGCPWEHEGFNAGHQLFRWLRRTIESAWLDRDHDVAIREVALVPTDPDEFVSYVTKVIQEHPSGVTHPLFGFLKNDASISALREFHFQESPFDVVFADLLSLMMAGLPGQLRQELAANLWDEVGNGQLERAHRTLRERMTISLGLTTTAYRDSVERFAVEELALANLYFRCALDRGALVEGIGMMLATELVVPGRIDCQLDGCLRVGLSAHDVHYLAEHVTVDVGHAESWLQSVVLPIVRERPEAATDIMLGVWRRLQQAGAVCDRMYSNLCATA